MDQALVRRLREEVADILARQRREDAANGVPPMGSEDERQFARAVISRVLESHARAEVAAGRTPPSHGEEEDLAELRHPEGEGKPPGQEREGRAQLGEQRAGQHRQGDS
jgi:hypothetical protein